MSAPSKQHARPPTFAKEKVLQVNKQTPRAGRIPSSAAAEVEGDGLCCLSGDKPFFDVILTRSHIYAPYYLTVPAHMVPMLPRDVVPMVLTHGEKNWNMSYNGRSHDGRARQHHRFDPTGWRSFLTDNNLRCGDACIFELMESSTKTFRLRVVILRDTKYLPPELREDVAATEGDGRTRETPIEIN